jgi:hypothetical protein
VQGSLAAHLLAASEAAASSEERKDKREKKRRTSVPGVFTQHSAKRIAILNSSFNTLSEDTDKETVLVFPDYKVVIDVDRSREGAAELWDSALDPAVEVAPTTESSVLIPYSCVIMLCTLRTRSSSFLRFRSLKGL